MHLSLLTDGIYPHLMGGMQKHSYYLAKYLARAGVKVDVYHAIPEGQPLPTAHEGFSKEELQNLQFFPVYFPKPTKYPGHYIRESYIYSKRVYKEFIKQPKPDFVYIQGFSGWAFLKRRAKAQSKKVFAGINFHGVEMFQKAPSLRVKMEHLLLRPWVKWNLQHSDVIFSLGGKLTTIQNKLAKQGIKIIEMPIGITSDWLVKNIPHSTSNIRKFVFIGRYERRKGIEELHHVLQQLLKENQKFEFHFIGPIPESQRLNTTDLSTYSPTDLPTYRPNVLTTYRPNDLISYHGQIQDEKQIQNLLQEADVLVCPSWSEGMPTVILEAMASGCAVIASDVGAVSEQVDNTNGILIDPGNKEQLKAAIENMLSMDNDTLKAMKKSSVARIKEKFLWEQVAERTIQAIRKLGQ